MEPSTSTVAAASSKSNQTLRIVRQFLDSVHSYQFEQLLTNEFEQLKQLTNEIRLFKTHTTHEGDKECNRKKNRYRDIVPYDDSRVVLNTELYHESSENDYINASFVRSALDGRYKYIAAQGPSKETIIDFVRMLVQFSVKIVICACNEYEGQKLKCFRYWTDKMNENLNLNKNYFISLKSKPVAFDGCVIRELVVRNLKPANANDLAKEYEFTQFHITNWPDHGVPNNIDSIMNTLKIVRHKLSDSSPTSAKNKATSENLAVHCSAGCGRTGTIIAIDQLWTLLKENKLSEDFSLFKIAYALREQRIAMIQTLSQYQLFARAVVHLFEEELANHANNSSSSNGSLRIKPFPVRPNHSNYDNISNLSYSKTNSNTPSSLSNSSKPTTIESENHFNKTATNTFSSSASTTNNNNTYSSPKSKRPTVDSNNNSILTNTSNLDNHDYFSNNHTSARKDSSSSTVSSSKTSNILSTSSASKNQSHSNNKSELTQSLSIKTKTCRFTPNSLFNIFTPHQFKSDKTKSTSSSSSSAANYPTSSTPSTTASISPAQSEKLSRNEYENVSVSSKKSSTDDSSSQNLTNSMYLKSNLTRSLMVTPASKTYLTSKNISVEPCNNTSNVHYLNLKQITSTNNNSNDSTTSSISSSSNTNPITSSSSNSNSKQFNKSVSPQFPRKLFLAENANELNSTYTDISNSELFNGSIRIKNHNKSTSSSSSSSSSSHNKNQTSELYFTDASLNKKEPGSVCEFLSNKLENNKNSSTTKSTVEYSKSSNSNNSEVTNNLISLSTMSDSNIQPATYSVKNAFVLSPTQAKLGSVKQTDLRQANPPLKAELLDSLSVINGSSNNNNQSATTSNHSSLKNEEYDQPPKPPARRSKKLVKSTIKEEDENNTPHVFTRQHPVETKKHGNFSNKYEISSIKPAETTPIYTTQLNIQHQNLTSTLQDTGVVFRSSRSNSSTYYDNHSETSYDNSQSHEHNISIRNALLIDPSIQQDLHNHQQQQSSKSKQPPLRVKTQKSVDSNISQTLPSRKSMSSINHSNNNYEINITDAAGKKRETFNSAHVSNPRNLQFTNHFNFPYRIQFTKNTIVNDPFTKQQVSSNKLDALDDSKYFLYNSIVKNDLNYLRNSENLNDINQMKRRSAHLFNL